MSDDEIKIDLKETGLRWISSRPISYLNYDDDDLESQMDHLIDLHLWYLPIPRFSRSFSLVNLFSDDDLGPLGPLGPQEQLIHTIETACKIAQQKHSQKDNIKGLEECNNFFIKHFKHISVLRDTSIDSEKLAFILGLMALDPVLLNKMPVTFHEKSNFIDVASEAIKKDIGVQFQNTMEMLSALHKHLELHKIKDPKLKTSKEAPISVEEIALMDSWPNYVEIKKTGFLSEHLEEFISQAIKHDSIKLKVSEETLLKCASLSSVTEELPEIAYNVNKQWIRSTYTP